MNIDQWDAAPFLKKILGIVPGIIYVFNQKTQSNEYTNRSMGQLLGYSADEIKEMADDVIPRLCHPDDAAAIGAHFAAIQNLPDGQVLSVEYRMRHKQGHWVCLLSHDAVFQRESDGSVLRHIGSAADITVQKDAEIQAVANQSKAEAAYAEQMRVSDFMTQIMDTAHGAIIALDTDRSVLAINAAGRHMLGGLKDQTPFAWPADIDFVDRDTMQPIPENENPLVRSLGGAILNNEIFLMSRTGVTESKYVSVSSSPLDHSQSLKNCVLIIDDISEQEKNRQKVERTSRLDALGQLTGGIAHDFNNLLATVQYSLELAQSADTAARHTYIETALRSVDRGSELTRRLLAFAKQQPGSLTSNNVASIISDFKGLSAPLIEATIEVDYVAEDDDLFVFCDANQLGNALLNLILNARDAILRSGTGNKITVLVRAINQLNVDATLQSEQPNTYIAKGLHIEKTEDSQSSDNSSFRYIEFAVTDNGPGMPEEVKRRAINPFFTTKSSNSGTGLGLSMVYGFIQQSNGELRIYSEPEQGTTMRMLLPRGTPSGVREKRLERETPPKGQGEKILIVEDEIRLAIVIRDLVRSLGYTVQTVTNGHDALAVLEREDDFELVITDIVMPGGLGGFELAEAIRKKQPDMPLIYMSGYTAYSDEDMGTVVAPMLQKPCPPYEMASTIHKALSSRQN